MAIKSNELETEQRGTAFILRFTRPDIRNPLSVTVLEQLNIILDDVACRDEIGTFVFSGSGASFASGADLREIAQVTAETAPDFARKGQRLMQKIAALPQRTVSAINGFCFGGALDLALACDLRIATPNAMFAHPGAGLGIITGWGGTQRLPRLVGQANALEMFFTASPITAESALRIRLIDLISDKPLESALK